MYDVTGSGAGAGTVFGGVEGQHRLRGKGSRLGSLPGTVAGPLGSRGLVAAWSSGQISSIMPRPEPHSDSSPDPRTVHLLLWDGVELLDFAGPAQVLQVAGAGRAFALSTLSPDGGPVISQGFLRVVPHGSLDDPSWAAPDLLVIPGGETGVAAADARVMGWLPGAVAGAGHVLSVCTGALLLARAGVLAGRQVTTWAGAVQELQELEPRATVRPDLRWVTDGRITTAAGVTSGIDAALHLVETWLGEGEAERVTSYMEHHRVRRPDEGPE